MRLFFTASSPYARKARLVAFETGLAPRIEFVRVTVRDPKSILLTHSPVGKVPVLETDTGIIVHESSLICAYLDGLSPGTKLSAFEDPATRLDICRLEGIALGFLDALVTCVREERRPERARSAALIELERARAERCLRALEREAVTNGLGRQLNIAQLTVACGCGVLDFRLLSYVRRPRFPSLARFLREARFNARNRTSRLACVIPLWARQH